ncbi:MAG: Ig-like domain-containing protein, partial [Planctomycetota bacterium]
QPENGILEISPTGEVTYVPTNGFSGTDTVVYRVADGNGGTSVATATIDVRSNPNLKLDGQIGDFDIEQNSNGELVIRNLETGEQLIATDYDSIEFGDESFLTQDLVMGLASEDQISADSGPAIIAGGGGSDNLVGSTGSDMLHAGSGNDNVRGGDGDDRIFGVDGNNLLDGQDGDDFIQAGAGNDNIRGGAGDDRIDATQGNNIVDGGSGEDTVVFDGILGDYDIESGNNNQILIRNVSTGETTTVENVENLQFGDQTIVVSELLANNSDDNNSSGTENDDTISGGGADDTITGGVGDDTLVGGSGNDQISGQDGNDTIFGGQGNDILSGDSGDDLLNAGSGFDAVDGGTGNDTLQLDGNMTNFQIRRIDNGFEITDLRDRSNQTTIQNIENVEFNDGTLTENGIDLAADATEDLLDFDPQTETIEINADNLLSNDGFRVFARRIDLDGNFISDTDVAFNRDGIRMGVAGHEEAGVFDQIGLDPNNMISEELVFEFDGFFSEAQFEFSNLFQGEGDSRGAAGHEQGRWTAYLNGEVVATDTFTATLSSAFTGPYAIDAGLITLQLPPGVQADAIGFSAAKYSGGQNGVTSDSSDFNLTSLKVELMETTETSHLEFTAGDVVDLGIKVAENVNLEQSTVTIHGVPEGAVLSVGVQNEDGSWTMSAADAEDATMIPPAGFTGEMSFDVTIEAVDHQSPNLVFNSSFEDNAINQRGWGVFDSVEGWQTSSGEGIEIQENVAGSAADGDSKVELDSHDFGGEALGSNSSMYQDVPVESGQTYNLSVQYSPRPGVSAASNGVEVLWNGEVIGVMTADGGGLQDTDWERHIFEVEATDDTGRIEFRAIGTQDSLGGYIDDVQLRESIQQTEQLDITITEPRNFIEDGNFEIPVGIELTDDYQSSWDLQQGSDSQLQISQNVEGLGEGQSYVLSFDLDGDALQSGDNLKVVWNGQVIGDFTGLESDTGNFQFEMVGGSGDGSNTLTIEGVSDSATFNEALDHVSLTQGKVDLVEFSSEHQRVEINGSNLDDLEGVRIYAQRVDLNGQPVELAQLVVQGDGKIGVVGTAEAGVVNQIGYNPHTDIAEQVVIEFDNGVTGGQFTFTNLFQGEGDHREAIGHEQGKWEAFSDGKLIASGIFVADTSHSGTVDIELPDGVTADKIAITPTEYSGGQNGSVLDSSDFFLTSVSVDTVTAADLGQVTAQGGHPADLGIELANIENLEGTTLTISGVPQDALLSAGEINEDGTWNVPVDQMDGLSVRTANNFEGELKLNVEVSGTADYLPNLVINHSFETAVTQVDIVNGDFESREHNDGEWTYGGAAGWETVGADGYNRQGDWDPTSQQYANLDADQQVGWANSYTSDEVSGLGQTLDTTFDASKDYTLSVDIGNRADGYDGEYEVRILAGDTVIGSVTGQTSDIGEGQFQTVKIDVTGSDFAGADFEGQNLRIELLSTGNDGGGVSQVNFDNVRMMEMNEASTDRFSQNSNGQERGWGVFDEVEGWKTSDGSGIEIQESVAGNASDGLAHVELDSHDNSGMYQDIPTQAGQTYVFSFDYSPRPGVAEASNVIEVYWEGEKIDTISADGTGLGNTQWEQIHYTLEASSDSSQIEFRAAGTEDSLGGYIDDVSVRQQIVSSSDVVIDVEPSDDPGNFISQAAFETTNDPGDSTPLVSSTTGDVEIREFGTDGIDFSRGNTESNDAILFREPGTTILAEPLTVNHVVQADGVVSTANQTIPAGTPVESYFLHLDTFQGNQPVEGSITFDRPIHSLIFGTAQLNDSDHLGRDVDNFMHESGDNGYARHWGENGDRLEISDDGYTLKIKGVVNNTYLDDVRIVFVGDADAQESTETFNMSQDVLGLESGKVYSLTVDVADPDGSGDPVEVYFGGEKVADVLPSDIESGQLEVDVRAGSGDGTDKLEIKSPVHQDGLGIAVDHVEMNESNNLLVNGSFENLTGMTDHGWGWAADEIQGWTNNGIQTIDFSELDINSHGGEAQDRNGVFEIQDDGQTLHLPENGWKSIPGDYNITANTVIEFQYKSTELPEFVSIGFDNDATWHNNSGNDFFKIFGSQEHGDVANNAYSIYEGDGEYQTIRIPVGQFMQGQFDRMTFINDDDGVAALNGEGATTDGNSSFRNVRFMEESRSEFESHRPRGGVEATDGDYWMDMGGSPGNLSMSQHVPGVVDGESYTLSFDLADSAHDDTDGLRVVWNGEVIAQLNDQDATMDRFEFQVTGGSGDGSNTITFEGTGTMNNVGVSLDNVVLEQGPMPMIESLPATTQMTIDSTTLESNPAVNVYAQRVDVDGNVVESADLVVQSDGKIGVAGTAEAGVYNQIGLNPHTNVAEQVVVEFTDTKFTGGEFQFTNLFEGEGNRNGGTNGDEQAKWEAFEGDKLVASGVFTAQHSGHAGTVNIDLPDGVTADKVAITPTEYSQGQNGFTGDSSDFFITKIDVDAIDKPVPGESHGLHLSLSDQLDGDRTLVTISGVPEGAQVNSGVDNGDGSWSMTAAEAAVAEIQAPDNYSGKLQLQVEVSGVSAHSPNMLINGSFETAVTSLNIDNGDFQQRDHQDGGWSYGGLPGWESVGESGYNRQGDWDPTTRHYANLDVDNQVGWANSYTPDEISGIGQTLETSFDSEKDYTLSVDIGNRADGLDGEYEVRVLAGDTVVGSVSGLTSDIANGTFKTVKVDVDGSIYSGESFDGQLLRIELLSTGNGGSGVGQVNFDNVRMMEMNDASTDRFSQNSSGQERGWGVFDEVEGWQSSQGAGIEIQESVAGSASDGLAHVELDSHNNSGMYQAVTTEPGRSYQVSFEYSPRPGVAESSNVIEVYWNGQKIDTISADGKGLSNTQWERFTYTVDADSTEGRLEFKAAGTQDSLGGYLDNVSMNSLSQSSTQVDLVYGDEAEMESPVEFDPTTFIPSTGTNFVDGYQGIERVLFSGNAEEYFVDRLGSGEWLVQDQRTDSPEGITRIRHIDLLIFADTQVSS